MYLVPAGPDGSPPKQRPYPEGPLTPPHPPTLMKSRVGVKTKSVAKRKNGKYVHSHDKWVKLSTKMREANLREEVLMADFT
jgi:hypothetical protein